MLKRPTLPEGFQGKVFKDSVRVGSYGVGGQLMDILLVSGEVIGGQENTPGPAGLGVWGLQACGQYPLHFSHLVGVSVSAKQPCQRAWLRILAIILEEELKFFDFV